MAAIANARVERLLGHLTGRYRQVAASDVAGKETITVIDNRTGKSIEIPIKNETISAEAFFSAKGAPKLRLYDPGCMNTVAATSRITFLDGDAGKLSYRGYPIEQLAEKSSFLEVSYLLLYGELPNQNQFKYFQSRVMRHTYVHEDLKQMMKSFRYDAHPMGMLISAVSALSTFHPGANPALAGQNIYDDQRVRNKQIHRILGCIPTIAAYSYRHRTGRPYVDPSHPSQGLTYTENFLFMLDKLSHADYRPHPVLVRALDVLFILHADHELNCSTSAMRHLASSGVDVYSALAGAAVGLYGPRHGGANEAVLRMLDSIGTVDKIPAFIDEVKNKKGGSRLMGFGHRVYKNYDPRAKVVRQLANEVFALLGKEPLIEVAAELERIALEDKYFIDRKLYPNVDFYSGVIYKAMGFPTDYFPVLFALPRTVGWLAHWMEFLDDPENRIIRPRQVYLGPDTRDYVDMAKRPTTQDTAQGKMTLLSDTSAESIRREVAEQ